MIDEERAKKEAAGQMTFEQKINLLNDQVLLLIFFSQFISESELHS